MRKNEPIVADKYVDVDYHQFSQSPTLRLFIRIFGIFSWPIILPLVFFARLSDLLFVTISQLLSLVPYIVGRIVRYEFYRYTLTSCGKNVMIGFGTVFLFRDIKIGDNVLIGMYNVINHCDFGSYVLGIRWLSFFKWFTIS